ncbi:hypothetical protein LINPERHAP1_LOCUS5164 [Linum perenne]
MLIFIRDCFAKRFQDSRWADCMSATLAFP